MSTIVLIQGSLNPTSRTSIVVDAFAKELRKRNIDHEIIDLRSLNMELCDGRTLKEYPQDLQDAYEKISQAKIIIFGMPVYCFSVSGPLKNFIDIVSKSMIDKIAAVLCNAGGARSYLAAGDLMKILSFESSMTTLQPIVKTNKTDFQDGEIITSKVHEKIQQLASKIEEVL